MRIDVITGDHKIADPTKPRAQYGPEDLRLDQAMRRALESMREHAFTFLNDHSILLDRFLRSPPDLAVNFCDTGYRNVATRELNIPALLEILGIPFTGCTPASMVLCYDKEIVRLVTDALGIPTPRELYLGPRMPADLPPDIYPALIKPNRADGSLGINKDAVVRDADQARDRIRRLRTALPGRALLVQEYLPGPEYTVGLIGNPDTDFHTLPVLEVDFSALPEDFTPILCYESKTDPDSPYYNDIAYRKSTAPEAILAPMREQARRLFQRFSLQDYGRFDFRADAGGTPKLLEINPNPAWDAEAKFALMAGFEGIAYADMLAMIIDTAIERIQADASQVYE